ncbi:MAG: PKD domain-containing protein, partial [Kiritimatiellae bacterium]|nr:PKD domain-containing protein [Kiritimatiellia bacterium]
LVVDGSASYDPDGTVVRYEWDLDHDGNHDDAVGAQVILSWTNLVLFGITNTGTVYPISLKVWDNEGASHTTTSSVLVVRENAALGCPLPVVVYSDGIWLAVPVTDDEGETLRNQAMWPKTVRLEILIGTNWTVLAEDTLSAPNDTDHELDFSFRIRQGVTDLPPGTYLLRLRFDGDTDYDESIREGTLTVAGEQVVLSEPHVHVTYGSNVVARIAARDDDGDVLCHQAPGGLVAALEVLVGDTWVLIGEDKLCSTNNDDYLLEYAVTVGPAGLDLSQGTYPLRVRFGGSTYYAAASASGTLTVSPVPVRFVDDRDLPPNDWEWRGVYTASNVIRCRLLTEAGSNLWRQAAEPKLVYLELLRGTKWYVLATNTLDAPDDSASELKFACRIVEGMQDAAPGTNILRFRFDGDSRHACASREAMLIVDRQPSQFVDPDGDWTWSFAERDERMLYVRLVDSSLEYLHHLRDDPKPVTVEFRDGTQWVEFASTVISESMPAGSGSTYEDALIRFRWTGESGTYDIRFRFDGDRYYLPAEHAGTMSIREGRRGSLMMLR